MEFMIRWNPIIRFYLSYYIPPDPAPIRVVSDWDLPVDFPLDEYSPSIHSARKLSFATKQWIGDAGGD
jgi:hypothetical protein